MRKKLITFLTAALTALAMMAAPAAAGGPPGDGICGSAYGEFHQELAQMPGPMGQVHQPGVEHRGAAGLCLAKFAD